MSLSAFIAVGLLALPSAQQSSASTGADAPAKPQVTAAATVLNPDELPVSLTRIQRALARPPSIRIRQLEGRDGRPLYRVDVEAEKVDIQRILGDDFLRGPVSYGGMTHQEFLDLVTPDYARGYAAFSNAQGLVVAATSIALKWAVLKAIDKFKDAKDSRAQEEAKKEVREALEALRQARRAAGLPDK